MIIGCGALGSSILRVVKQFHPHSITVTDIDDAKLQEALDMINAGNIDLRGSISHTWPMEKAQEAFDFVTSHDPSYLKGVLTFDK